MTPEKLRGRGKWLRQLTFFAAERIADDIDEAADDIERLMLRVAELEAAISECDGSSGGTFSSAAISMLVSRVCATADVPLPPEPPVVSGEVVK